MGEGLRGSTYKMGSSTALVHSPCSRLAPSTSTLHEEGPKLWTGDQPLKRELTTKAKAYGEEEKRKSNGSIHVIYVDFSAIHSLPGANTHHTPLCHSHKNCTANFTTSVFMPIFIFDRPGKVAAVAETLTGWVDDREVDCWVWDASPQPIGASKSAVVKRQLTLLHGGGGTVDLTQVCAYPLSLPMGITRSCAQNGAGLRALARDTHFLPVVVQPFGGLVGMCVCQFQNNPISTINLEPPYRCLLLILFGAPVLGMIASGMITKRNIPAPGQK